MFAYGHIWSTLDTLHRCVVSPLRACEAPRAVTLHLPAGLERADGCGTGGRNALHEVVEIFNGSYGRLQIVQSHDTTVCAERCCNAATPAALQLRVVDCCLFGEADRADLYAVRRLAWDNIGVPSTGQVADTVVLLSNRNASSGRRLHDEEGLSVALRRYVAEHQPSLRFVLADTSAMHYRDELRLLSRTRMLISVFGSSLYGCRFMPQDSYVLQIHGALKNDRGFDANLYSGMCGRQMGMRWVGVPGSQVMSQGPSEEEDYWLARVDAATLLEYVDGAFAGNGDALHLRFARWMNVTDEYSITQMAWRTPEVSVAPPEKGASTAGRLT